MKPIDVLRQHNACGSALEWVREQKTDSVHKLWVACPRADWLLWIAARIEIDRQLVVLAACDCARTVLRFVPDCEDRPRIAIETAERWARGEATLHEVRDAGRAAYDAAYDADADADAADYAADAACAGRAAYAAAYAASASASAACAGRAAHAAAYAADYAAASAAYDEDAATTRMATLVRRRISARMIAAILRKEGK